MQSKSNKNGGLALLIGAIMITVTMALHPVGGDIAHLKHIEFMIIITHSLAIMSIPVMVYGFRELTKSIGKERLASMLAFITMALGLFAVMLAAALNGLAVPFFLRGVDEAATETTAVHAILDYSFALNKAMDYVFIGACVIGIGLYSLDMKKSRQFPSWLSYFGLLLGIIAIISIISGFGFTSLMGFRIFIFSLVAWMLIAAIVLIRKKEIK